MDTWVLYGFAVAGLAISFAKDRAKTKAALKKAFKAVENILPQFLMVLLLVAVTLAVLNPETISRFIGSSSEFLDIIGASLVGAITLVPGFVAFPAAAALLAGGAGATQIAAFVSSLMMVGIVTLPMEMKYSGRQAALLRNGLAWIFSIVAAFFVGWVVGL
ncbi:MAG: permease [Spirochaetota bacterium]